MEELLKLNFTNEIWIIAVPLILMVIDIITGYYNAWKSHNVKSTKMRDGIGKKIAEMCYIIIGYLASFAFGLQAIKIAISIYIIYMELMSIAENCKKLGVAMPKILSNKLNNEENSKNTKK